MRRLLLHSVLPPQALLCLQPVRDQCKPAGAHRSFRSLCAVDDGQRAVKARQGSPGNALAPGRPKDSVSRGIQAPINALLRRAAPWQLRSQKIAWTESKKKKGMHAP